MCVYTVVFLLCGYWLSQPGEDSARRGRGRGKRRRSSRQQQRQPATAASDVCERYRYLVEGICVELAYNRRADLLIRNPAYTCPESCILCANTIFSGRLLSLSAPVGPFRWYARPPFVQIFAPGEGGGRGGEEEGREILAASWLKAPLSRRDRAFHIKTWRYLAVEARGGDFFFFLTFWR